MAEKDIPTYRCTYCLQALTAEDRQDLFGSDSLCPKSDDAENFVTETQSILRYSAAVAMMLNAAEKIGEEVVYELHHLVGELTEEAIRRLDRAQDALEVVWDREEAAKKATHARKEEV
jgi:hypothetical protein